METKFRIFSIATPSITSPILEVKIDEYKKYIKMIIPKEPAEKKIIKQEITEKVIQPKKEEITEKVIQSKKEEITEKVIQPKKEENQKKMVPDIRPSTSPTELKKVLDEKIEKKIKMYEIWKKTYNPNLVLSSSLLTTNIHIWDSEIFNRGFLEFLSYYNFKNNLSKNNTFITSKSRQGKYSINFTEVDNDRFINKISTSIWCKDSPYYPKSHVVNTKNEYNNLNLIDTQKYFVKPKTGAGSKNIGISIGKTLKYRPEILENFPIVFQENVNNLRLNDGRKEDERVYVLWIKMDGKIRVFLYEKTMVRKCTTKYSEEINRNTHFTINVDWKEAIEKRVKYPCEMAAIIPLIRDISQRVIPNISKKMTNDHKAEFWLTGWDILFDTNNFPWLLEINSRPNQCETIFARELHYEIYQNILEIIFQIEKNQDINSKHFVEIIL